MQNFSCSESGMVQNRLPTQSNWRTISLCAQTFTKWVKLSYLLTTHIWILVSQFSTDAFSITKSLVPHNPKNNLYAKSTHFIFLLSINKVKKEPSHRIASEKILTEITLYSDSSSLYCLCCSYNTFELQLSPSSLSPLAASHHDLWNIGFYRTAGHNTKETFWLQLRISSKVQGMISTCANILWTLGKESL